MVHTQCARSVGQGGCRARIQQRRQRTARWAARRAARCPRGRCSARRARSSTLRRSWRSRSPPSPTRAVRAPRWRSSRRGAPPRGCAGWRAPRRGCRGGARWRRPSGAHWRREPAPGPRVRPRAPRAPRRAPPRSAAPRREAGQAARGGNQRSLAARWPRSAAATKPTMATRRMSWRAQPPARQQAQRSLRGRLCGAPSMRAPPTRARQPAARVVYNHRCGGGAGYCCYCYSLLLLPNTAAPTPPAAAKRPAATQQTAIAPTTSRSLWTSSSSWVGAS